MDDDPSMASPGKPPMPVSGAPIDASSTHSGSLPPTMPSSSLRDRLKQYQIQKDNSNRSFMSASRQDELAALSSNSPVLRNRETFQRMAAASPGTSSVASSSSNNRSFPAFNDISKSSSSNNNNSSNSNNNSQSNNSFLGGSHLQMPFDSSKNNVVLTPIPSMDADSVDAASEKDQRNRNHQYGHDDEDDELGLGSSRQSHSQGQGQGQGQGHSRRSTAFSEDDEQDELAMPRQTQQYWPHPDQLLQPTRQDSNQFEASFTSSQPEPWDKRDNQVTDDETEFNTVPLNDQSPSLRNTLESYEGRAPSLASRSTSTGASASTSQSSASGTSMASSTTSGASYSSGTAASSTDHERSESSSETATQASDDELGPGGISSTPQAADSEEDEMISDGSDNSSVDERGEIPIASSSHGSGSAPIQVMQSSYGGGTEADHRDAFSTDDDGDVSVVDEDDEDVDKDDLAQEFEDNSQDYAGNNEDDTFEDADPFLPRMTGSNIDSSNVEDAPFPPMDATGMELTDDDAFTTDDEVSVVDEGEDEEQVMSSDDEDIEFIEEEDDEQTDDQSIERSTAGEEEIIDDEEIEYVDEEEYDEITASIGAGENDSAGVDNVEVEDDGDGTLVEDEEVSSEEDASDEERSYEDEDEDPFRAHSSAQFSEASLDPIDEDHAMQSGSTEDFAAFTAAGGFPEDADDGPENVFHDGDQESSYEDDVVANEVSRLSSMNSNSTSREGEENSLDENRTPVTQDLFDAAFSGRGSDEFASAFDSQQDPNIAEKDANNNVAEVRGYDPQGIEAGEWDTDGEPGESDVVPSGDESTEIDRQAYRTYLSSTQNNPTAAGWTTDEDNESVPPPVYPAPSESVSAYTDSQMASGVGSGEAAQLKTAEAPDIENQSSSYQESMSGTESFGEREQAKIQEAATRRHRCLLIGICICVIALILAVVLPIFLTRCRDCNPSELDASPPSPVVPILPPSSPPVSSPVSPPVDPPVESINPPIATPIEQSVNPTVAPPVDSPAGGSTQSPTTGRLGQFIDQFLGPISGFDVFDDINSPQYRAAIFIAENDDYFDEITSIGQLTDRYAAVTFYFATGGERWTRCFRDDPNCAFSGNGPWLIGDTCSWFSVSCNLQGRVTSIYFSNFAGNGLVGTLPNELAQLSELEEIALINDQVGGTLPLEFTTNMINLRRVILQNNLISGELGVSIFNRSPLEALILGGNQFRGTLPNQIGNQGTMQQIVLDGNFLEGSIPMSYAQYPQLVTLTLSDNRLQGTLPPGIYAMPTLQRLHLNGNSNMVGFIPSTISRMQSLIELRLNSTSFGGSIPTELYTLGNLAEINLSGARFSGRLSESIRNLGGSLRRLHLSGNNFVGVLPAGLDALTNLNELSLHGNDFTGAISQDVCGRRGGGFADLQELSADCTEVECTCCSQCF